MAWRCMEVRYFACFGCFVRAFVHRETGGTRKNHRKQPGITWSKQLVMNCFVVVVEGSSAGF